MSLRTDIIQLFGTGSVPVLVAGSVLGVFELGERFASQRAKDALSKWLLTFEVRKEGALPDGTQELFERIFGERHFSLKCFMRSAAFSLGAMALIIILGLLIRPNEFVTLINSLTKPISWYLTIGSWLLVTLWIPWSILVDYFSLFKTRIILRILTRLKGSSIFAIVILLVDYYAYLLLYIFGQGFAFNSYIYIHYSRSDPDYINLSYLFSTIFKLAGIFNAITQPELPIVWFSNDPLDNMFSTFFWAGFAPSIWMWLYVAALFVTLGLLRSEKLVNWLRWFLDVEKAPFRSIGAVAATLAFIASIAIIFVSAEVSRISAAS